MDRDKLAEALPRLEDTADELSAVAKSVGASRATDLYLREMASETNVKMVSLADYKVVYFATHGLVAGEVKGLAEPSLVLTIPKRPSDLDDGLLTAGEIAELKLNADWVVLSACNTIAGEKPRKRRPCQVLRALSSMRARGRCWCRTGRSPPTRRPASPPRRSTSLQATRRSGAPRRCVGRCSAT